MLAGAVEGDVDQRVLERLVAEAGGGLYAVFGREGKAALRDSIRGYNNDARFNPWVVVVDLDDDFDCAPRLVADWLPRPARLMRLRVAVREIEAWLLADRERIASFLGVPVSRIPESPDAVEDPKRLLVSLAQRSRRKGIREDLVPRPRSGRRVGHLYNSRIYEFVASHWRPDRASEHSESLRRCRLSIARLVARR
jgi:hypothetical protein